MVFVDIEFPPRIAFGAQTMVDWQTEMAQTIAGWENANQRWTNARHAYDVSFSVRNSTDYAEIKAHYIQVRGRLKSFPFKDYLDFECSADAGLLVSNEDSPPTFAMHKTYGSGNDAWLRPITRPMPSPVPVIYRWRDFVTTNASADATIDYETGDVEMDNDMPGDIYTWAGQFWVPCRYDADRLPAIIINKEPGAEGELLTQCDAIPIVEVRER